MTTHREPDPHKRTAMVRAKYGAVPKGKKQDIRELPRWVRMALVEYETLGMTYKECAKKFMKGESTLRGYGSSPAGKTWRAQIREMANDPVKMAEATIRSSIAGVTLDYLLAYQNAIDRNDYKEVGVMSRDLLDRVGVTKKERNKGDGGGKHTIVINLGGGVSLEKELIETSYEEPDVQDADYEIVSDG
jgi:hypothetical protein